MRAYSLSLRRFGVSQGQTCPTEQLFVGWRGKPFFQGVISEFVGDVLSWFGYSLSGVTHVRRVVSTELQMAALNGDISGAEHSNMIEMQVGGELISLHV